MDWLRRLLGPTRAEQIARAKEKSDEQERLLDNEIAEGLKSNLLLEQVTLEKNRWIAHLESEIQVRDETIKRLEEERQKMLDRLLLKNGLPPVHAQLPKPQKQQRLAPHEAAIEEAKIAHENEKTFYAQRAAQQILNSINPLSPTFAAANVPTDGLFEQDEI